jgi:Dicarboxylate carrier protein MatC N-terminus
MTPSHRLDPPLGNPLSHELISLAVLAIVFLVATVRGVNMGALALISAFIVGVTVYGLDADGVLTDFPA